MWKKRKGDLTFDSLVKPLFPGYEDQGFLVYLVYTNLTSYLYIVDGADVSQEGLPRKNPVFKTEIFF